MTTKIKLTTVIYSLEAIEKATSVYSNQCTIKTDASFFDKSYIYIEVEKLLSAELDEQTIVQELLNYILELTIESYLIRLNK